MFWETYLAVVAIFGFVYSALIGLECGLQLRVKPRPQMISVYQFCALPVWDASSFEFSP